MDKKKFILNYTISIDYEYEVEAEDLDDAKAIAEDNDCNAFKSFLDELPQMDLSGADVQCWNVYCLDED